MRKATTESGGGRKKACSHAHLLHPSLFPPPQRRGAKWFPVPLPPSAFFLLLSLNVWKSAQPRPPPPPPRCHSPPSLPSPPLSATPREGEYEAETTKKGRRELRRRRRGREHVVTPGRSRRGEENFQENCQNITCGAACPGPRPSVRLSPLPSIPRGGVIIPRPFRRAAAAAARLYGEREEEKEATMRTHLLSDERRAALAMHPP